MKSLEIVLHSEIGRESEREEQSSFLGMKTVLDIFQESGTYFYPMHKEKIVAKVEASGSIDLQLSYVSLSRPGEVFSALANLERTYDGVNFSIEKELWQPPSQHKY